MTITETITQNVCDKMLAQGEAEQLGYFAACCDLMAADPTIPVKEMNGLLERAAKYRELQAKALEL
jgi:hypothetical protein